MTERTKTLSRRNFLLAVGTGGAATAAAAVIGTRLAASPKKVAGKRDSRGYHASEHVNNYYRTAKV